MAKPTEDNQGYWDRIKRAGSWTAAAISRISSDRERGARRFSELCDPVPDRIQCSVRPC